MMETFFLLTLSYLFLLVNTAIPHPKDAKLYHINPKFDLSPHVHMINYTAFREFNSSFSYYFLMFNSKNDTSEYDKIYKEAASIAYSQRLQVGFGRIDKNILRHFPYDEGPILYFFDNVIKRFYVYLNEVNSPFDLIQYARRKIKEQHINEVSSVEELTQLLDHSHSLALFYAKDKESFLANKIDLIRMAFDVGYGEVCVTDSLELIKEFAGDDKGDVQIYSFNLENKKLPEKIVYDKTELDNTQTFRSLLEVYKSKLFGPLEQSEFDSIINDKFDYPYLIVINNNEDGNTFIPEVAKDFRRFLRFRSTNTTQTLAKFLNLSLDEISLPALLFIDKKDGKVMKFLIKNFEFKGEIVSGLIVQYFEEGLNDYAIGKDDEANKQEEEGEENIRLVSNDNLESFLSSDKRDIVFGICDKKKESYQRFIRTFMNSARKLHSNKGLIFVLCDDCEYPIKFKGLPAVYFLMANEDNLDAKERLDYRILFDEDITTENLTRFISINAKSNVTIKVLENENEIRELETKEKEKQSHLHKQDDQDAEQELGFELLNERLHPDYIETEGNNQVPWEDPLEIKDEF